MLRIDLLLGCVALVIALGIGIPDANANPFPSKNPGPTPTGKHAPMPQVDPPLPPGIGPRPPAPGFPGRMDFPVGQDDDSAPDGKDDDQDEGGDGDKDGDKGGGKDQEGDKDEDQDGDDEAGDLDHLLPDADPRIPGLQADIADLRGEIEDLGKDIADLSKEFLMSAQGDTARPLVAALNAANAEEAKMNLDNLNDTLASIRNVDDKLERQALDTEARLAHAEIDAELKAQHAAMLDSILQGQMAIHDTQALEDYDGYQAVLQEAKTDLKQASQLLGTLLEPD